MLMVEYYVYQGPYYQLNYLTNVNTIESASIDY